LFTSVSMFAHILVQQISPVEQSLFCWQPVQFPFSQGWPWPHTCPQDPQLLGSALVSTHVSPQQAVPRPMAAQSVVEVHRHWQVVGSGRIPAGHCGHWHSYEPGLSGTSSQIFGLSQTSPHPAQFWMLASTHVSHSPPHAWVPDGQSQTPAPVQ